MSIYGVLGALNASMPEGQRSGNVLKPSCSMRAEGSSLDKNNNANVTITNTKSLNAGDSQNYMKMYPTH